MSLEALKAEKEKIDLNRDKQLKVAIDHMHAELAKIQVEQAAAEEASEGIKQPVEKQDPRGCPEVSPPSKTGPLVYLSYTPLPQQNPHPAWVGPIRTYLINAGYTVYTPWMPVEDQVKNVQLNSLQKRLLPQLCSAFRLQEELTLDYERVFQTFVQADRGGDFDCIIFRNLWFLSRASLMIADLTVPERLGVSGVTQEMLYARLLEVPTIAIAPESGFNNPWLSHCASVMYTGQFSLAKFSPLIRGFAPLPT